MNRRLPKQTYMKKQSGFTMIEIMIASLIGIFLMTGMMNLFITTNRSVSLSDGLSQNQETGRFAMDYLTKFVRRAGYTDSFIGMATPPLFIPSGSVITCTATEAEACAENNPDNTLGDRLSVPFMANADLSVRSCTGTVVGGPANGEQNLVNVFWVSAQTDSLKELRCRTYDRDNNNWLDNPVSIVNNVEAMEFQVGVARAATERYAARYVSVDTVQNGLLLENVRSIRIAILTTSQDSLDTNKIQTNKKKRVYALLDAPQMEFTDGSLRSIFSTTIELPNSIEQAGQ